jgi:hypothetical protein
LAPGTTQPLPNELFRALNFAFTSHIRLHGMVLENKVKMFQQIAPEHFFCKNKFKTVGLHLNAQFAEFIKA